jgi:UDPglucose 6-dehydrogenase
MDVFLRPDRVVVGVRSQADRARVEALFRPITDRLEWMSIESAEMTKHALNAFMATSVTFINEIASLCEAAGADAKEVERGLKTDARIGPRAYLSPGSAFSGGTLARDVTTLSRLGAGCGRPIALLSAVLESNEFHKGWASRKLETLFTALRGRRIAVWGLTYKPGTDTLRRSAAVELCRWLSLQGALVHAHDPAVGGLPVELAPVATLHPTPLAAVQGAAALVVATEWSDYRSISAEAVLSAMEVPVVIDPGRFLIGTLGSESKIRYITIGQAL